ncbi:MAG: zinc ABC transporter substrate-binding protein [Planctomycetota bacterium]
MKVFFAILLLLSLILGCDPSPSPDSNSSSSSKLNVATTFYPLTEFARRIGGDAVDVQCFLPEGEDPIFWKPSPEVIQKFQQSEMILINGAEFEKWVSLTSLPAKKLVNTAHPFKEKWVRFENAITHSHGGQDAHSHEGVDGHTWVSSSFAKIQAEEIKKAFVKARPDKKEVFEKNYKALEQELSAFEKKCSDLALLAQGKIILTSHPAYNYLGVSYGFKFKNFNFDPEEVPAEESLNELAQFLQEHPATFILWESFPSPPIEKLFKEKLKLQSMEFSPVENLSAEEIKSGKTFISTMKANLENLEKALKS